MLSCLFDRLVLACLCLGCLFSVSVYVGLLEASLFFVVCRVLESFGIIFW